MHHYSKVKYMVDIHRRPDREKRHSGHLVHTHSQNLDCNSASTVSLRVFRHIGSHAKGTNHAPNRWVLIRAVTQYSASGHAM